MKRPVRYALVAFIFVVGAVPVLWQVNYENESSQKNLRYQCWKLGLCSFDLDLAVQTVLHDTKRDELILGKSEAELNERFGYLIPRKQPTFSHRWATKFDENPGDARLFIRKSDMMVTMKGGKAVRLSFIKGG